MSTPKGYKCKTCGERHAFPLYVYSHWRLPLNHRCKCGAIHELLCGKATQIKAGQK